MEARAKVWVIGDGDRRPLVDSRLFERQTVQGFKRVVISTDTGWCALMLRLIAPGGSTFSCLYERRDAEQDSRLESLPMPLAALEEFVAAFLDFLETDPRHNFWVFNHETQAQVVLDEHNHMFVYGRLDDTESYLRELGFSQGRVELPTPHIHVYTKNGAEVEAALIARLGGR